MKLSDIPILIGGVGKIRKLLFEGDGVFKNL